MWRRVLGAAQFAVELQRFIQPSESHDISIHGAVTSRCGSAASRLNTGRLATHTTAAQAPVDEDIRRKIRCPDREQINAKMFFFLCSSSKNAALPSSELHRSTDWCPAASALTGGHEGVRDCRVGERWEVRAPAVL